MTATEGKDVNKGEGGEDEVMMKVRILECGQDVIFG